MTNKKNPTHVLQNEETITAIAARVKRAQGQLGAVARMLDEGRNCDEIIQRAHRLPRCPHFIRDV